MPIETAHPEYLKNLPIWQRIRDCMAGDDAVKERGDEYLSPPDGLSKEQYQAYKKRAYFFNATMRTVQGLHGAMFRKPPESTVPAGERFAALLGNLDLQGTPVDVFASSFCWELLAMGRVGLLTEMTDSGEPYLVMYITENVRNWREASIGNVQVPDQYILTETYSVPAKDGYGSETKIRYRVLELDENGLYRQRIHERPADGGDWVERIVEPSVRGKRINYIPFTVPSPAGMGLSVETSPIKDLADANLAHYRSMADLKHALHWTACPTAVFVGDLSETSSLAVGSMGGIRLPAGTTWGIMSAKANDFSAIFSDLDRTEGMMAKLGARLLEDQKRAAETAESKRLQYSGENSVLATIANTASRALTRNIGWAVEWLGGNPSDVVIQINTDFFDATIDPTLLSSMLEAVQGGYMSTDTFIWNLIKGELTPPGRTVEEEKELIEMQGPALAPNIEPPPADANTDTQQVA